MNQTGRVRQGLGALFVSSSTEVAKAICSVRLSPFVGKVWCKSISPEMENSGTAGAADLWGNGNQSQPNCNPKSFLACTSPAEFPLIWITLPTLWQTIGLTTACWLLKLIISERECQGVLTEALLQPFNMTAPSAVNQAMPFPHLMCPVLLQLSHVSTYTLNHICIR